MGGFSDFYIYQDGNRFGMKSTRLAHAVVQASSNDPSLMLRAEEGKDYIVGGFDSGEGILRFATANSKKSVMELVDELKKDSDVYKIMFERPKKDYGTFIRTENGWN